MGNMMCACVGTFCLHRSHAHPGVPATFLPCCHILFSASEKALILFLTHGGCGGLVSAYSKEKSCCHGQSLVGFLWAEHSITHLGTLQTGLG